MSGALGAKKWRESDTIKFVELYEQAECLWNFRHPVYKNRFARDRAIQHIVKEMNLPDFGANELKNKIKNIRSTYQQEVNKIKRSRMSLGDDIMEEYRTNLAWFPIADRFLSKVINGVRNHAQKSDEEEISYFFQANNAFNVVETEMTTEPEEELKYPPFAVSIKEEVADEEEYAEPVPPPIKRRKLSSAIENGEPKDDPVKQDVDEWSHFGNNISCQLRSLPLERALMCQKQIFDIMTQSRIEYLLETKK